MGLFFKIIGIGAGVVLIVGVLGLLVMSGVAVGHGVEPVPLPLQSYIAAGAASADYTDAYRVPMPYGGFRTIDDVIANAFQKGREIHRSDEEVVYEGDAPGLHFYVSYLLDRTATPPTLTMATRVRYLNRTGRWYFIVVRQVHRRLTPIMLDQMAQSAASM